LNKVVLVGRLGQDVELRYTQGQTAVATLNVATKEREKVGDTWQEATEWHRVVVWGKSAENASKYLAKGREVSIMGRLKTRNWEDKNGVKKYTTEIIAQEVEYIGGGKERKEESQAPVDSPETPGLDDIPF